jgi:hypothetical protein
MTSGACGRSDRARSVSLAGRVKSFLDYGYCIKSRTDGD